MDKMRTISNEECGGGNPNQTLTHAFPLNN